MRPIREIYDDSQDPLRIADNWYGVGSLVTGIIGIVLVFGTYLIPQITEFFGSGLVGMGINTLIFMLLVWCTATVLTLPTALTGSWLAGIPWLQPFGSTSGYLANVVPSILFWACGVVLVNSVVPWFWLPFLSYFWAVAISIGMGIWFWKFKPTGDLIKNLSWKFLLGAMIWALVGLPLLSWAAPRFDSDAREEVQAEQLAEDRETEIDNARHNEQVRIEILQARAPKAADDDQVVDGCQQLAGIRSGLFNFIQGTEGCRHVTLLPNQFYDAAKGPAIVGKRCTRRYPEISSISYLDQPGPDRMTNLGTKVEDFVVYFLKAGEADPVDPTYTCR